MKPPKKLNTNKISLWVRRKSDFTPNASGGIAMIYGNTEDRFCFNDEPPIWEKSEFNNTRKEYAFHQMLYDFVGYL